MWFKGRGGSAAKGKMEQGEGGKGRWSRGKGEGSDAANEPKGREDGAGGGQPVCQRENEVPKCAKDKMKQKSKLTSDGKIAK